MAALSTTVQEQQKEGHADMAEGVIYRVMQQRHTRETVQLAERHERERVALTKEARAGIEDQRQAERERIVEQQEAALMALMERAASLDSSEMSKQKTMLKREQKKQLRDFDAQTAELAKQAEKEAETSAQVQYAHKRLELREQQMQELAGAMKELTPEQVSL